MISNPLMGTRPAILDKLTQAMQKKYGTSALRWMDETPLERERLSTGIAELDACLRGGLPIGSVCMIYGLKQAGKSSLAAHIAGQRKSVLYIDADRKMDEVRAVQFGLNNNNCILAYPAYLEEAMEMAVSFIKAGVEMVVIDSLPALTPRKELEEKDYDKQAGISLTANFLSRKLGIINTEAFKSNTTVLIVNQKRANTNMASPFAEPYHAFGGYMLQSITSVVIDVARRSWLKFDGVNKALAPYGQEIAFLVEKSNVSPPRVGNVMPFLFDEGFITYTALPEARKRCLENAKQNLLSEKATVFIAEDSATVEAELDQENPGE